MRLGEFRINLQFDGNQTPLIAVWLNRFNQNAIHMWSTPEISGGNLTIHPADFPNLLLQARPEDCTELEFYRIRKQGTSVISVTLRDQRSKTSSELYRMVVDALTGLHFTGISDHDALVHF